MVEVCAAFLYCLLWLDTIDVCIWRMFVFMSVVMTGWGIRGNVCCVAGVVKVSVF